MHQRRPDHPHEIAAPALLLAHARGQLLVVDRPLAAHLGGHEAELVGAVAAAEKPLGVHHDALGTVLGLAHGDEIAPAEPARLDASPAPPGRFTTTQSIRGRVGASQRPSTCTYVGRLEVEKKPSGSTPSAGSGSNRAAGAPREGRR